MHRILGIAYCQVCSNMHASKQYWRDTPTAHTRRTARYILKIAYPTHMTTSILHAVYENRMNCLEPWGKIITIFLRVLLAHVHSPCTLWWKCLESQFSLVSGLWFIRLPAYMTIRCIRIDELASPARLSLPFSWNVKIPSQFHYAALKLCTSSAGTKSVNGILL